MIDPRIQAEALLRETNPAVIGPRFAAVLAGAVANPQAGTDALLILADALDEVVDATLPPPLAAVHLRRIAAHLRAIAPERAR